MGGAFGFGMFAGFMIGMVFMAGFLYLIGVVN